MTCLVSLFLEKLLQKLTEMLLKQMKFWVRGGFVCSVNWQVVYTKDPAFKIRLFFFSTLLLPLGSQYYLRASVLGQN